MDKDKKAHIELGKEGEERAASFLVKNGMQILYRNWRYSHYELDIVAQRGNIIHFVEVKTRTSSRYGQPEDQVNKKKFKFLKACGEAFLWQHPHIHQVQFDIISVTISNGGADEIVFIEDVYF
jgi:putative endonuclease